MGGRETDSDAAKGNWAGAEGLRRGLARARAAVALAWPTAAAAIMSGRGKSLELTG